MNLIALFAATLVTVTPLLYATIGEIICERAGVLNLGIEGTMYAGAFVGFAITAATGSIGVGLLAAVVVAYPILRGAGMIPVEAMIERAATIQ